MIVAELEISKMYTAFAEDMGYMDNGLHRFQYYCKECGQSFMAAWGRKPGTYPAVENGSWFTCPNCGEMHHEYVAYIPRKVEAPDRVRLTVNVFTNVITFAVTCRTVRFTGDMQAHIGSYKEYFSFDISKQTVTFSRIPSGCEKESYTIGNPFDLKVLDDSILCFFQNFSLANKTRRSGLNQILKELREAVHSKLQKQLGYKVPSMYVSQGQYHGSFLLPIFNIAYRVTCPDAPNLPEVYRETPAIIKNFWGRKLIENFDFMENVMNRTRKRVDFIKALTEVHGLPDKPMVKRLLLEDPFAFRIIAKAFSLCKNYDCAISLYEGMAKLNEWSLSKSLFSFLNALKPIYGELGIVRMVNEASNLRLNDCVNLYDQLNKDNRALIKAEGVKIADLHDWMSIKHKMQNHKNLKFEVPDHIVKRLSMQNNRLEFFLPKESMELLIAGHELHNCVASYGAAMKDNSKWIVLVADDKGKLTACLEIQNNKVVQAKLDRNSPVSKNMELNNAILAWAKEANLKVETSDVKKPEKRKTKETKSA